MQPITNILCAMGDSKMPIDKQQKFSSLCSLTADYVRAYLQNTNFHDPEQSPSEEHIATCFSLAKATIALLEREYHEAGLCETSSVIH